MNQENNSKRCLLGAVAGDVIGSIREWHAVDSYDFELFTPGSKFTDDSVVTVAVADAFLNHKDMTQTILQYGRDYPHRGYGGMFSSWLGAKEQNPYNSFGNGSAMRASAAGWVGEGNETVLDAAKRSAEVTHNHPEGIKGAQSVALAILMARKGNSKDAIRDEIEKRFGYDLQRSLAEIRLGYQWNETCQGSVPESIIAFLESTDFESAVRNAIWLGGDADTMAAIAGPIAEAFYGGVPDEIAEKVIKILDPRMIVVLEEFGKKYMGDIKSGE
jgi:ADP-ribosylglycohydrolase